MNKMPEVVSNNSESSVLLLFFRLISHQFRCNLPLNCVPKTANINIEFVETIKPSKKSDIIFAG